MINKTKTLVFLTIALLTACVSSEPVAQDDFELHSLPDDVGVTLPLENPPLQVGVPPMGVTAGQVQCLALGNPKSWPNTFPRTVIIDSSWSDEHVSLILAAVERWNDAAGITLFSPIVSDEAHGREGTIKIDPVSLEELGAQGRCWWSSRSAHIKVVMTLDNIRQVTQHELGHALNLGHEEGNSHSIMSEELRYIAKYTPFIQNHLDLLVHCSTHE